MGKDRVAEYVLRLRPWSFKSFLFASICVAMALILRVLFASLGATLYFATFFPAILIVGLFAGIPAAIVAAAVTNIIVWWAFIPPQFAFEPLTVNDFSNFAMFWVAAGLMIWVSHLYRKTLTDLLRVEATRKLRFRPMSGLPLVRRRPTSLR